MENKISTDYELAQSLPSNLKGLAALIENNTLGEMAALADRASLALGYCDQGLFDDIGDLQHFLFDIRNGFNQVAKDNGLECYIPTLDTM